MTKLTDRYIEFEQSSYFNQSELHDIYTTANKAWKDAGKAKKVQSGWYLMRTGDELWEIEQLDDGWWTTREYNEFTPSDEFSTYKEAKQALKQRHVELTK